MNAFIAISKIADGNMLISQDQTNKDDVVKNRSAFLESHNIAMSDTTCVQIKYIGDDYCRYHEVSDAQKGNGMFSQGTITADALVTRKSELALFLPLADCVGVAIFDPNKQILMLSHIGRHSLEQNGAYKSVRFLVNNYYCSPDELLVWLTPSPSKESYPLFAFNNRSFKDVIFEQLRSAGIIIDNITDNPTDTTKDLNYFSHSEFLKGNRREDGRYGIVAMMIN